MISPSSSMTQRTKLDNGIVVIATENPASDIVAARLFLRAGSRHQLPHQAGLANLVSAVITKGTDHLSSQEIAEQVESIGASVGADATPDYFLLSLKTVSADFADILTLAGHLLRSPTFPDSEVALEQRLVLQSIRSRQEQPFVVASDQLRRVVYQSHPYGTSVLGNLNTVAALTPEDLRQFHRQFFRPDNLVISVVGRIQPADVVALVQEVFGDWQAPDEPLPIATLVPVDRHPPTTVITAQETQQAVVMLSYLGPAALSADQPDRCNPDYIVLKLISTYLGNGLSSRLFVELREKQGLAYEVSAFYPTHHDPAQFTVYMGTAPENTPIAREGLQRECDRLTKTLLELTELKTAKNKLLGQYALGKQTNAQIAQVLGWYETLGLGIEFDTRFPELVSAVTADEALAVAQRYFTEPYVSLVGPASAVGEFASIAE